MTNTKVSNNNPDKESIINKSITKAKDNEVIKNKTIQNKKVTSVSKKPNKSVDDISNEIFSELISKIISLVKEIKDLETCLLYTSPSPRDGLLSRMPSSA